MGLRVRVPRAASRPRRVPPASQPRQTSYAINDSDILGAPQWFSPADIEVMIANNEVKGELTAAAFRHWQEFRRGGSVSGDVIDIPN